MLAPLNPLSRKTLVAASRMARRARAERPSVVVCIALPIAATGKRVLDGPVLIWVLYRLVPATGSAAEGDQDEEDRGGAVHLTRRRGRGPRQVALSLLQRRDGRRGRRDDERQRRHAAGPPDV